MSVLRWLGIGSDGPDTAEAAGDTETVRRIAASLERLPPERRRHLAAFAYVLARVAHADLETSESEAREMERIVSEVAGLGSGEAALAVEIAKTQAQLLGGTENYVVTREFRKLSTPEQRVRLVDCLFAVAAAEDAISSQESQEISNIAEELGLSPAETAAIRSRWREHLSVLRKPR